MKFKVGDRVKVIANTSNASNKCIGLIGKIYEDNTYHYSVKFDSKVDTKDSWQFYPDDLELVNINYKLLKPITLNDMLKNGAQETCKDFIAFAMKAGKAGYTWDDEISLEDALEWRKTNFFFERRYIEEVKQEVFYKVTDRFKYKNSKEEWMIAQVNYNEVMLVATNCNDFFGLSYKVKVQDRERITLAEFKRMADCCFDKLVKIDD